MNLKWLRELSNLFMKMLFNFVPLFPILWDEISSAFFKILNQLLSILDHWHFYFFFWSDEVKQTTILSFISPFLDRILQLMHQISCWFIELENSIFKSVFNHQKPIFSFQTANESTLMYCESFNFHTPILVIFVRKVKSCLTSSISTFKDHGFIIIVLRHLIQS